MAFISNEMGNDLSSAEEEARHQAFKDVRTRAFFKQGFEAGTEVARYQVKLFCNVLFFIHKYN